MHVVAVEVDEHGHAAHARFAVVAQVIAIRVVESHAMNLVRAEHRGRVHTGSILGGGDRHDMHELPRPASH